MSDKPHILDLASEDAQWLIAAKARAKLRGEHLSGFDLSDVFVDMNIWNEIEYTHGDIRTFVRILYDIAAEVNIRGS